MATLSRTKKYQDLRDSLQHDNEADSFSTNDLSRFEKRLNEIDSQNFSYPETYLKDDHSAEHARSHESKKSTEVLRRSQRNEPSFDTSSYYMNENDATFDNDYLDQYIREVKQYNIDQGNAASENTQINILKQIERNKQTSVNRPFARSTNEQTTDIPFIAPQNNQEKNSSLNETVEMNEDTIRATTAPEAIDTQALSKEDIMAEVQNLVNGSAAKKEEAESPFVEDRSYSTMSTDTFNRRMEADRTTRQQLLNETTQMRAQLDDYEDNLSEVSDKMRQTSRILNIVLIILIIALAVLLGVVIYWIVIAK